MGIDITKTSFSIDEFERFGHRLQASLPVLRSVLQRPGFGIGDITIGAELELALLQADGRPAPCNQRVLADLDDPRFAPEVNRYNLELNAPHADLAPNGFSALASGLSAGLQTLYDYADQTALTALAIGILPTLVEADMAAGLMTPLARYRTLDQGLARLRGGPFELRIQGPEEALELDASEISYEGANTSFQLHLRVDPEDFARSWNAAQMATALVLAASGNSPFFLGRRLWEETRIIAFKQSIDGRDEESTAPSHPPRTGFGHRWMHDDVYGRYEEFVHLFPPMLPVCGDEDFEAVAASGGIPKFYELRLHAGTVWHWNRPVLDTDDGGHIRIEMRALPAGPTLVDMVANAAALIGLTLALRDQGPDFCAALPVERGRAGFYEAARVGLQAEIAWPRDGAAVVRPVRDLLLEWLPAAERALVAVGMDPAEVAAPLRTFAARVESARTGAVWQCTSAAKHNWRSGQHEALGRMVSDYARLQRAGAPVHEWPLAP